MGKNKQQVIDELYGFVYDTINSIVSDCDACSDRNSFLDNVEDGFGVYFEAPNGSILYVGLDETKSFIDSLVNSFIDGKIEGFDNAHFDSVKNFIVGEIISELDGFDIDEAVEYFVEYDMEEPNMAYCYAESDAKFFANIVDSLKK